MIINILLQMKNHGAKNISDFLKTGIQVSWLTTECYFYYS